MRRFRCKQTIKNLFRTLLIYDSSSPSAASPSSTQPSSTNTCSIIVSLPLEILSHILSLLEYRDLYSLECVCKDTKRLCSSEYLWKTQYLRIWKKKKVIGGKKREKGKGKAPKKEEVGEFDWKEMYKARKRCESAWRDRKFIVSDLRGHTEDIICLQYNEDLLATGSGDGMVKLWDMKKKKCKTSLSHSIDVFCLQMEGNLLASGGGERHITIWDIMQEESIVKLPIKETVKSLQLIGHTLVSGSADGFVHVHDLRAPSLKESFWADAEDVWCLQVEGHRVVCGGVHPVSPLNMWDLRTMSLIRSFMGHAALVSCLQFEGNKLVSGSADTTVKIWDMNTGECLHTLQNDSKVFCVYLDDQSLISGCDNAAISFWDINSGAQLAHLANLPEGHMDAVLCAQFDLQRMVTGSYDKTIKVWDLAENCLM